MNEEVLINNIRVVLQEELKPIKNDLAEIKKSHYQLSKDIVVSLGEYHDKLEKHVDNRTEALNKRVYHLETVESGRKNT